MHKEVRHTRPTHKKPSKPYIPSVYEKDIEPEIAVVSRLMAGLIDISILLALKIVLNIFFHKFALLIIPIYYFLCLQLYSTTIGGVIFGIKIVEKTSKRTNIRFPHAISRSLIISAAVSLIYYSHIMQTGMLHYVLPAILGIIYVNPIIFTKNRLTLHDYLSKTKVIKFTINNKKLIKKSVLFLFTSILIICTSLMLETKCKENINIKNYNEAFDISRLCSVTQNTKYSKDNHYTIGISLLKNKKARKSVFHLEKAAILGKEEAEIFLIQSYALSGSFRKAQKQTAKMIHDLAAPLIMSNMFITKYKKDNQETDLYNAYIYLNIYHHMYSQDAIDKSILSRTKQKSRLQEYYPIAKKYIKIAENKLNKEKIRRAQEEGIKIMHR